MLYKVWVQRMYLLKVMYRFLMEAVLMQQFQIVDE